MKTGISDRASLTIFQVREIICGQLGVDDEELSELVPVKAGMTNT